MNDISRMIADAQYIESDESENTEQVERNVTQQNSPPVNPEVQTTIGNVILYDWYDENHSNFTNIKHIKIAVGEVRPKRYIVFCFEDPKGDIMPSGNPENCLKLFEEADTFAVLDLPGYAMEVYSNGLKILHEYTQLIHVKSYPTKKGVTVIQCLNLNGRILPYNTQKLTKKNTTIDIFEPNPVIIQRNLEGELNLEALQLQYRQVQKCMDEITDKLSAIDWLLETQKKVRDINHLLQIDSVLQWLVLNH